MGIDLTLVPMVAGSMDNNLRQLKRQVATGDVEAMRNYIAALERITDTKNCYLLPVDPVFTQDLYQADETEPSQFHVYFSHCILPLERRRSMWSLIHGVPPLDIPQGQRDNFTCYLGKITEGPNRGESCYGKLTTDPYGSPIQWVGAGPLGQVIHTFNEEEREESNGRYQVPPANLAAAAFLRALPENNPVALYWH